MPNLILIKHAPPLIEPNLPPDQWHLSDEGRRACRPLAEALREYSPAVIVHSREPKAAETAAGVAEHLHLPIQPADDLHEHDRSNVPHLHSAEFISMVELFFRKPDDLVLGRETAAQALARFTAAVEHAVERVASEHPDQTVAIVSHGTVIALYVAALSDHKPFDLWRRLKLPSFVVVDSPSGKIGGIVDRVG